MHKTDIVVALANNTDLGVNKADLVVSAFIEQITNALRPDDLVVCTLKDAVKLAPRWPRLAPPLWYVSQHVIVERGVGGLERVLDDLVRVRSRTVSTAG